MHAGWLEVYASYKFYKTFTLELAINVKLKRIPPMKWILCVFIKPIYIVSNVKQPKPWQNKM